MENLIYTKRYTVASIIHTSSKLNGESAQKRLKAMSTVIIITEIRAPFRFVFSVSSSFLVSSSLNNSLSSFFVIYTEYLKFYYFAHALSTAQAKSKHYIKNSKKKSCVSFFV